ncbi:thiopeptide-type bacteriocin biosynthesis protein [Flavobacterium chryseum]|uniref:thiopeptide-type bacteriocin biosynthesis protein n=1 Tax=Flavobacterium sp. P3160 TaxID=2512113 RepID=UPI00105D6B06|nr:thiopeptide-type bacteriocin biosynthesis protein [Flavobacterium sp. P3160]TDO68940.1 thiopeptide-type bacteriocin biosynthesis protein [Flavobacterium sp. P3160]
MRRDFCLGSEWLYYKIYTGVKTSDYILLEKLQPIISSLEINKIIQKWFFIRYQDPEEHIRIRFLVKNTKNIATIIQALYPIFEELLEQNLVWNIQTDTYKREIERYGKTTMIDSEFFFWKDSQMALQYIRAKPDFLTQETPLLFSFYAIDSFLNSFQLSIQEKLSLMDDLQSSFKIEFKTDKEQKKEMSKSYAALYPQMNTLMTATSKNIFIVITRIVNQKSKQTAKKALEIKIKNEIPLESLLASHIHMMVNRQYTSKQRMYELIIYDHLFKYYKTKSFNTSSVLL